MKARGAKGPGYKYHLNGDYMPIGEIARRLYMQNTTLYYRKRVRGTTLQEEIDREWARQNQAAGAGGGIRNG